eukprot:scaffold130541_cov44-Phaeocystis_antarctica.AAC.1
MQVTHSRLAVVSHRKYSHSNVTTYHSPPTIQMEFDREALDNQRAKLSNQRANVRSVLKRIGSEGLNPLARLQGEGLEKVV